MRTAFHSIKGDASSLPQSRHRKTAKTKKRPRGYAAGPAPRQRQSFPVRSVAILIVIALAISVAAYVITHRGPEEITTPSGLRYTDLRLGTGPTPQRGQTVTVHYIGTLENGKQFDSSYDRGAPADFRIGVGQVVRGWDEGLMSMKTGGKRRLVIPPKLGYPEGRPPDIPPNSTLIFEVELLGVK